MLFFWKVSLTVVLLHNCTGLSDASLTDHLENSTGSQFRTVECLSQLIFGRSALRTTLSVWKYGTQKPHKQFYADLLDTVLPRNKFTSLDFYYGYNKYYTTAMRVYLVDSAKTLRYLIRKERPDWSRSPRNNMYLIVLPPRLENPMAIVEDMLTLCWSIHVLDITILVEAMNGVITFYTYCPFEPGSCNSKTPVVLGQFDGGQLNVSLQTLFPLKMRNFWKCPLRAVAWKNAPFIIFNHTRLGRIEPLSGVDGMILIMLSKALNLTLNVIPLNRNNSVLKEAVFAKKIQRVLRENEADLAIGNLRCTFKASHILSLTDAYFITNMRIIIRPPNPYSSLEMLFIPFDIYCWIIIILYFTGRRMYNLVARKYSHRSVDTSQIITRIRLVIYLFSYNIIRGAYEGSVFNFLHHRPEKHLPANLEDAISQGYKFLVDIETFLSMEPTAELKKSLIVVNVTEKMLMSQMKFHPGKIGMLFLEDYALRFLKLREEYSKFYLVKEIFSSKLNCIYVPKYSNLIVYLNKRLMQLKAHGLIGKFHKDYLSAKIVRTPKNTETKQVLHPTALGLYDMTGIFQIYAALISLCMVVLFLELASKRSRKLKRVLDFFH